MARPAKFRHDLEDLTKPHLASQIAGYVSEIELYRKQVEEIQSRIAQVYDDMDEEGFDKAIVRKLIAKRAKGEKAEAEAEAIDAYEIAVEKGFSSRARVANPETVSRQNTTTLGIQPSVQSEAEAGASPEEGLAARAAGVAGHSSAHANQFVTSTGEGEGAAMPADPSPAADEPIRGLAAANAIAARAVQPAAPKTERAEIDITIPAFLRRTAPGNHPSFGEQA